MAKLYFEDFDYIKHYDMGFTEYNSQMDRGEECPACGRVDGIRHLFGPSEDGEDLVDVFWCSCGVIWSPWESHGEDGHQLPMVWVPVASVPDYRPEGD